MSRELKVVKGKTVEAQIASIDNLLSVLLGRGRLADAHVTRVHTSHNTRPIKTDAEVAEEKAKEFEKQKLIEVKP